VAGAFTNPKGITVNSNNPYFVMNAVFSTSLLATRTWWYPDYKSNLLKYLEPDKPSRTSSILGIGYESVFVFLFNNL